MTMRNNRVFGNRNKIPIFKAGGVETLVDGGCGRDDYGTSAQTYIIDGSGLYLTRNRCERTRAGSAPQVGG